MDFHTALGDPSDIPARWRSLFDSGASPPLPEDGPPGDWLSSHREPGQTFTEYVRSLPTRPVGNRRVLSIQPLGIDPGAMTSLVAYTWAWFQLPVRVAPPAPLPLTMTERLHPIEGHRQILAADALVWLASSPAPSDACCRLALTGVDLYPGAAWSYVFGLAWPSRQVAIASSARYADPRPTTVLRRTIKVVVHELGHLLGLAHCTWFRCAMNGSNHLAEADARPLRLCPVCLRKLAWNTGFDPVARQDHLDALGDALGIR